MTERIIPQLVINKLTESQYEATTPSSDELYFVTDETAFEPADATILKQSNIVDNVTSTTTTAPLSANMGKTLQDEIDNLKNIGRFLAIWNCSTGLPTTNPTTLPYTYKTGDYFRVGAISTTTNYKPNGATYTGVASSTVETEDVEVGWVYYYDGSAWATQSGGGGGTVQDVQVNSSSILDGSGIANITDIPASIISSTLSDSQIASASIWNAKQDAIVFNSTYSATTNKAATMNDINVVCHILGGAE